MKPRQRLPQKQSARLYARKNDHRDILYYDEQKQKYIYHNALYWTEEDETKAVKEHVAWVKYAKNALLHQDVAAGWIDLDRQFNYAYQGFGQSYNMTYYLEEPDITVMLCGYYLSSAKVYWTKDGVVWHDITPTGGIAFFNGWQILRFGENGVCSCYYDYNARIYYVRRMLFEYDAENDEVTYTIATNSYATTYTNVMYLCNTQEGIIVYEGSSTGGNDPVFYTVYSHIKADGSRTMTEQSMANRSILGTGVTASAYCKHDNHCCIVLWGERLHAQYTGHNERCVEVMCTHDNGNTWHGQAITDIQQDNYTSYVGDNVDLFYRNGYFYAIYAIHEFYSWRTRMFKSQFGISWEEVILPKWVDLPLIQGGGTAIATPSKETLRIAIDPPNTSGADVQMNFLIPYAPQNLGVQNLKGGNFALGNILYQDGKITENDHFWYKMGGSTNGGSAYHAYFDIEQLGDTSKAFAWQQANYVDTGEKPDTVIPYDYCAPRNALIAETEENNG